MEDNKETIVQNNGEGIEAKAEETRPASGTADDDIQYTFVVPKGEVFREPEEEADADSAEIIPEDVPEPVVIEPEPAEPAEAEADPAKTIIADRSSFTGMKSRTPDVEPPVYAPTGLPDDADITYTFVVPKGEVYREPDPEEEKAAAEAERAAREAAASADILSAETKVMERKPADGTGDGEENKTRYGLPVNHPEMGELAQKQEARILYKQRKRNRFRTRFYVLVTSVVLIIGWLILSSTSLFTIDSIVVQGNSHYTAEEIINMGHASPGRNIIYKANIKETEEYLENNPYIKNADVKRRLPSTLVIKVTEREERMAFKYDDDYLVMDEDGILLKKTRNKPKTTVVQGVVVNKIKLGEKIGAENGKTLDMALDIVKTMIKSDLYYVKVEFLKNNAVNAYIYDTLIVKTDYDALMTNMENGRLHLVMEKLYEDGIERGTITFGEDGSASFMPIF